MDAVYRGEARPTDGNRWCRFTLCVAGKSAGPPEDCGGAQGCIDLRALLADPAADGHDEMLEWLGIASAGEFDPAAFDVEAGNESLAAVSALR